MTKVLQLGYGNYGRFHTEAWLQLGFNLTVVDPLKAGLSHMRQYQESGQWSEALKDVVIQGSVPDKTFDLVDIVTPVKDGDINNHVKTLYEISLTTGVPIFVEKPLKIYSRACPNPVYVGYGYRFCPGMERLKRLKPPKVRIDWYGVKRPEWNERDLLWNDGVHIYDLTRWLTGSWPDRNNADFYLSNTKEGDYPDPVVKGCKTTKMIYTDVGTVDFSTVHPIHMLKEQFKRLQTGKDLHTLEDSIELTKKMEDVCNSL